LSFSSRQQESPAVQILDTGPQAEQAHEPFALKAEPNWPSIGLRPE
jgi:hypothetical protein